MHRRTSILNWISGIFILIDCVSFFLLGGCQTSNRLPSQLDQISQIIKERIVKVEVRCATFSGKGTRLLKVYVLDTVADSVKKCFEDLLKDKFPVYAIDSYINRNKLHGDIPSMHALGVALDVNASMNPCFSIEVDKIEITPKRFSDKYQDRAYLTKLMEVYHLSEQESTAVLNFIVQPCGYDDWFLNRNYIRDGMITPQIAAIFKRHGFDIWGGMWRQPVDYMHFQPNSKLAEALVRLPPDKAAILWQKHLIKCNEP
jgi:hypothetical protein